MEGIDRAREEGTMEVRNGRRERWREEDRQAGSHASKSGPTRDPGRFLERIHLLLKNNFYETREII